MGPTTGQNPLGLKLIGTFKFVSGLMLVGLGVGLFRQADANLAEKAEHIVAALRLDPGNHYIHSLLDKIPGVSPRQIRAIGIGTFLYALMYLVEGGGLLLRRHWAEYLTVVATGLFIPLEIYEVVRRPTPIRIGLLVINTAIVAYLVVQLRRKGKGEGVVPAPSGTLT